MAVANLLTLIDDIATILDDVAVYSKLAAKKTAPVLGDDLAVNAEQVTGVKANRELPVVWAVTKGSLINKCILVPIALLISAVYPPLIQWLLMLGGAFLCFEGAEKILHSFSAEKQHAVKATVNEKQKIRGAIRTDFILSAEIIVIALGSMAKLDFTMQAIVLSIFALGITVLVYGLVAGIVKLDDAGLALLQSNVAIGKKLGSAILWFAPHLMKSLSVLGMLAMLLVGGGILVHGVELLHHLQITAGQWLADMGFGFFSGVFEQLLILVFGLIVGLVLALIHSVVAKKAVAAKAVKPVFSPHSDFSGQNLSGQDFSPGKNKQRSELFGSNFTGANLSHCNFSEADLRNCNFTDADLSGANFTNAGLSGSVFNNTRMQASLFKDTRLFDIEHQYADFSDAIMATRYQGKSSKMADKNADRDGVELL
jgi:predicted DNA repair protein MutK